MTAPAAEISLPRGDELEALLQRWLAGEALLPLEQQGLVQRWQAQPEWAAAFGLSLDLLSARVQQQLDEARACYPHLQTLHHRLSDPSLRPLTLLWDLWLPLAMDLKTRWQSRQHPYVLGILGGQGSGKSTLVALLAEILTVWGLRVCCLSLDDLYLTYAERQQLQSHDPRLRWRGPPGTHDVALGCSVLQQLRQSQPVAVPRFDKSLHQGQGDRTPPQLCPAADLILFEGWFVGLRPIEPGCFDAPEITTESDRQFARDCNIRLAHYLPLWEALDSLLVLRPTDYHYSLHWRQQAEQRMIASGRTGLSDAAIAEFVQYFWRSLHPDLFLPPLLAQPGRVDWVVEIGQDHSLKRIFRPSL